MLKNISTAYATKTVCSGSEVRVTLGLLGCGGSVTFGDMKNDILKSSLHAGPWPGKILSVTGAVISIFSSGQKGVKFSNQSDHKRNSNF